MIIITVIWKSKTYKYGTWLYRFLDKVYMTDSKGGNTYHNILNIIMSIDKYLQ